MVAKSHRQSRRRLRRDSGRVVAPPWRGIARCRARRCRAGSGAERCGRCQFQTPVLDLDRPNGRGTQPSARPPLGRIVPAIRRRTARPPMPRTATPAYLSMIGAGRDSNAGRPGREGRAGASRRYGPRFSGRRGQHQVLGIKASACCQRAVRHGRQGSTRVGRRRTEPARFAPRTYGPPYFQAGHASSILITRSTASGLVRGWQVRSQRPFRPAAGAAHRRKLGGQVSHLVVRRAIR